MLDFLSGLRWLTSDMKKKARTVLETPLVATLGSRPNDGVQSAWPGVPDAVWERRDRRRHLLVRVQRVVERCPPASRTGKDSCTGRRPSLAVWQQWQDKQPVGGFDAIIGNPPWDRIKLYKRWSGSPLVRLNWL